MDNDNSKSNGTDNAIVGVRLPSGEVKRIRDVDALHAADIEAWLFAQYYPEGNVTNTAELSKNIQYDFDTVKRTATVYPFCKSRSGWDNSHVVGKAVIPPFVDTEGNPYIIDDGSRYRVIGVKGADGDINPNSNLTTIVAPTTVTTIGESAFVACTSLASVSLPAVTGIGDGAFYGCSALASVSLPAAITIGEEAFYRCSALASVSLSAVTTIGDTAFFECSALASVSLPAVTTIGVSAFQSCYSLPSVSLPAATSIGGSAFSQCGSLVSVSLPAATSIGVGAFHSCDSLPSVSLPVATTIENDAFSYCESLRDVSLPAATSIGGEAFSNSESLRSVSLPSATTIGDMAFLSCTSLSFIDFGDTPRSSVPTLGEDAFGDASTTFKIIVPDAQYDAWKVADGWSSLVDEGHPFLRHSEWEYVRWYEVSLSGREFDFSTMQVVISALKEIIEKLGGTVVHAPTAPAQNNQTQGE